MSLWCALGEGNRPTLGRLEATRLEYLDTRDPIAVADRVCTYVIRVDGRLVGEVRHRQGDGEWALVRAGLELACAGKSKTKGVRQRVMIEGVVTQDDYLLP